MKTYTVEAGQIDIEIADIQFLLKEFIGEDTSWQMEPQKASKAFRVIDIRMQNIVNLLNSDFSNGK